MAALDPRSDKEREPEKKRADFSNVQGGSSSTAPDAPVEQRPVTESVKKYTVIAGDSLSRIAQREYGDASAWKRIFDANKHIIKDPDLIYPGQELTIP